MIDRHVLLGGLDGDATMLFGRHSQRELPVIVALAERFGRHFAGLFHVGKHRSYQVNDAKERTTQHIVDVRQVRELGNSADVCLIRM